MAASERPRGKMVVSAMLFWYPLAGVTFQVLHYLIALRRLGWDVTYVEDLSNWVYDPTLHDLTPDASRNVDVVARVLEEHGFDGQWAFRSRYEGGGVFGMDEARLRATYAEADVFLNVTAAQEVLDEHLAIPRRIYVESDPFPAQVRADQGHEPTLARLRAHDTHFTFGESVGTAACPLPSGGVDWLPTRQPVATELWPVLPEPRPVFTTITTWRNRGKDVDWDGETYYWTKDREFLPFLELPAHRPGLFELAVKADAEGEALLDGAGWGRTSSFEVSRSLESYQRYISSSRGEFTVARDQYVRPSTGWFSDRSACYLAAGRPVITQDTGFGRHLPTGEGLFAVRTVEDVLAAVDAVNADYARHSAAAREVAEECFRAETVVGSLLERAGL